MKIMIRWRMLIMVCGALVVAATGLVAFSVLAASAADPVPPLWQDLDASGQDLPVPRLQGESWLGFKGGQILQLDLAGLRILLQDVPSERSLLGVFGQADFHSLEAHPVELSLPLPGGGLERFAVVESSVMAPELAAKYPNLHTFAAQGLDDRTLTARLDLTPHGFHAAIHTADGMVYIDPLIRGDDRVYLSYRKTDLVVDPGRLPVELLPIVSEDRTSESQQTSMASPQAGVAGSPIFNQPTLLANVQKHAEAPLISSGTELRTYRLAVAATGEYTLYFGGTVTDGMAAIVTAINRVDEIYEREVAVRLVLVADNDLLVYTDPDTDPYVNNDGYSMLYDNQDNLDVLIGDENYDIGHVFSTGGGGVAYLGVPCDSGMKARGVTGLKNPVGDAFWVDYVAHEMGHQFGANHSFNGTSSSCGGGNRNAGTAYEPGSGSTIMSYAGICGAHDLQEHSDAYFHTISFDEISTYIQLGDGSICPVTTPTGNHTPAIVSGSGGYIIPQGTPFQMTGAATDPDGDVLTYAWEQFDLGLAGPPPPLSGYAAPPHFRSFYPMADPYRVFPQLNDLLEGTTTIGEALPTVTSTLTFRFTARDNRLGGGGVAYKTYTVDVSGKAGPFLVTAPLSGAVYDGGSPLTVTWDVAGTTAMPVSCSKVNLDFSTDGGRTFSVPLAVGKPNDGFQRVTMPNIQTTQGRVRVSCANNIFFAISEGDFTVEGISDLSLVKQVGGPWFELGETVNFTLTARNSGPADVSGVIVTDTLPAGLTFVSASPGCAFAAGVVTCGPGYLLAGAEVTYGITVTVDTGAGGIITNTALVSSTSSDVTSANNRSSAMFQVVHKREYYPLIYK